MIEEKLDNISDLLEKILEQLSRLTELNESFVDDFNRMSGAGNK